MPRKPKSDVLYYNTPFSSRLSLLMAQRGVKQQDLVPVLGVKSHQAVSCYITGKRNPSIDKIIALAKFFDVSADYLLGLSDSPDTVLNEQAVLDYTGLTNEALEMIVWAKNEDRLDVMEMFIRDKNLQDAGVNLRNAAEALAAAADRKNCPPDKLAKKQELFDLSVFRLLSAVENLADHWYRMERMSNVAFKLKRMLGK